MQSRAKPVPVSTDEIRQVQETARVVRQNVGKVIVGKEEVIDLLGWDSSDRSREVVDEAVVRYAHLNYRSVLESSDVRIRSGSRLVAGYRAGDESIEGQVTIRRVYREVRFNVELLNELKEWSLFGIDWSRVRIIES